MTEALPPFDPTDPRYWDEHHLNDSCDWKNKPTRPVIPEGQSTSVRRFAENAILHYISFSDKNPKWNLYDGQTFDGTKFPQGTVIRFSMEELLMPPGDQPENRYLDFVRLGVICSYTASEVKKKIILPFIDFASHGQAIPITPIDPIIRIGAVQHLRVGTNTGHIQESLSRVRSLSVQEIP